MAPYRIYELKADGQFVGPPLDVCCRDDQEVILVAHGMMPDAVPEIWQGTRRLAHDPTVLIERAELWRAEAAATTLEDMRTYCLAEAERCARKARMAFLIQPSDCAAGRAAD
jgi:hypothetical protein